MKKGRLFRPLDGAVLLIAVGLFVGSLALTLARGEGKEMVYIEGVSRSWVYPRDAEIDLEVPGPLGATHVHIHGGSAWVSESPCAEKICIGMGSVDQTGQWIACLPNRVFVRVDGAAAAQVDRVAH